MKPKLSEQAKGKWPGILQALGVSRDFLTGKHGPCPICKDGKDRFRFDNKDGRGTFYCSQCGAGDGIEFVKRVLGVEFKEAAREIEKHLGTASVSPVRVGRSVDEVKAEMNAIWRSAKPLQEVAATSVWWMNRLGKVPATTELRGVERLRCQGERDYSAQVALVRDADGKPVNLHRTYLTASGEKAPVEDPRRVMDTALPKGSAVRLSPAGETLGVAEGIETAMAAELLTGIPTWALLNANNMKGFVPSQETRRLVIFGDLDSSFTGQAAAFELARSLWVKRKDWPGTLRIETRIYGLMVDPEAWDRDWNDALQAQIKARAA